MILKKPSCLVTNASPNWTEKPMATFFSMAQNVTQSALTEIEPGPPEGGRQWPSPIPILSLGLHWKCKKHKLWGEAYF